MIGDDGVYTYEIKELDSYANQRKAMIFWTLLISFFDDLWKIRELFGGKLFYFVMKIPLIQLKLIFIFILIMLCMVYTFSENGR